jgi:hypothetical protein
MYIHRVGKYQNYKRGVFCRHRSIKMWKIIACGLLPTYMHMHSSFNKYFLKSLHTWLLMYMYIVCKVNKILFWIDQLEQLHNPGRRFEVSEVQVTPGNDTLRVLGPILWNRFGQKFTDKNLIWSNSSLLWPYMGLKCLQSIFLFILCICNKSMYVVIYWVDKIYP